MGVTIGFEEFLLRHALGEPMAELDARAQASAVMMIPIPAQRRLPARRRGRRRRATCRTSRTIQITAKPDQQLLSLPEGASYLGFIFARAAAPAVAEHAVREAHARLRFTIDPLLEIIEYEIRNTKKRKERRLVISLFVISYFACCGT